MVVVQTIAPPTSKKKKKQPLARLLGTIYCLSEQIGPSFLLYTLLQITISGMDDDLTLWS